ncbi:MAG TPA: heme biosynthesis HemY N-terminal domain-containing protein [Xanthobacteraceae bacterium]|nr:heme biosynthesis HemY N-terminal domain-containing protein [Xanthobacteraceae bacterium]
MIRLVVYLLALAALAAGIAWLADRPGEVMIVWQGWRIETSVMVAGAAVLAAMALAILLWGLLRLLLRSPDIVALALRNRRRSKGWSAVSRGLVAVGSGDLTGARRAAADAQRLIGSEPLARLLAAQAAQLAGDAGKAEAAFRTMADAPATRLLGLRGLHVEARRRGDANAALAAAEEAARFEPGLAWAADAVIEARCVAGDFAGARAMLEREAAHGGLDRAAHRRRRAVLLAAEAQVLEQLDAPVARERAVEAARLAPTLVPAAEIAGRLLGANGDVRRAGKVLEAAYAATPHPDLTEAYLHLRPGDSSRERLKRMRTLVARAPSHPESAMALARAALDAQDFATARTSLSPLTATPTQRVCLLMAELEATESGDIGKAREWTARAVRAQRDPAWIADGVVAERWGPISPVSGRLDAYSWSVPPGIAATPVLENEAERVRVAIAAAIESRGPSPAEPKPETPATQDIPRDMPNPAKVAPAPAPPPKRAEPVVATPHLPDDPGPGTSPEDAPAPRSATPFGV